MGELRGVQGKFTYNERDLRMFQTLVRSSQQREKYKRKRGWQCKVSWRAEEDRIWCYCLRNIYEKDRCGISRFCKKSWLEFPSDSFYFSWEAGGKVIKGGVRRDLVEWEFFDIVIVKNGTAWWPEKYGKIFQVEGLV